jgi:hypothetical protein
MITIEAFRNESHRLLTLTTELTLEAFSIIRAMKRDPEQYLNGESMTRLGEIAELTRRYANEAAEQARRAPISDPLGDWYASRAERLDVKACDASRARRIGRFLLDPTPDTMTDAYNWYGPDAIAEARERLTAALAAHLKSQETPHA